MRVRLLFGRHDVEREGLIARVDDVDGLVQVRHRQDGQDRPEDLLLHHRVLARDVGDDGQLDEEVIPVAATVYLIDPSDAGISEVEIKVYIFCLELLLR